MTDFLLLLFLISLSGLLIGLINSKIVIHWGETKARDQVLKYYGLAMIVFFILFGLSTSSTTEKVNVDIEQENLEYDIEEYDKIKVEVDFQDVHNGKQKIVVYITNTSDLQFKGKVSIDIFDIQGKYAGYDTITIDSLAPGGKTFGIIWGKTGSEKIKYRIYGRFNKVQVTGRKEKYTILFEQTGLNYITFYVKLEKKDKEYIINIIKEFRQIYTKQSMVGFQIYFYSPEYKGEKGQKPSIMYYYAHYTCNYNNGHSELSFWDTTERVNIK